MSPMERMLVGLFKSLGFTPEFMREQAALLRDTAIEARDTLKRIEEKQDTILELVGEYVKPRDETGDNVRELATTSSRKPAIDAAMGNDG
jgi:hypothetical protein